MLVLSRKIEESIMVGDDIEIKIIAVHGDTVKLGITAPKMIPVHRKEIYEEIKKENLRAVSAIGRIEGFDMFKNVLSATDGEKDTK